MKKKFDSATRGLFVHSNYLQSPEENKIIQDKLFYDDYNKRLTSNENTRVHDNMINWLIQCRKEW